ncbi:unnamed protein product [Gordionus sp. m RMFG-2023]
MKFIHIKSLNYIVLILAIIFYSLSSKKATHSSRTTTYESTTTSISSNLWTTPKPVETTYLTDASNAPLKLNTETTHIARTKYSYPSVSTSYYTSTQYSPSESSISTTKECSTPFFSFIKGHKYLDRHYEGRALSEGRDSNFYYENDISKRDYYLWNLKNSRDRVSSLLGDKDSNYARPLINMNKQGRDFYRPMSSPLHSSVMKLDLRNGRIKVAKKPKNYRDGYKSISFQMLMVKAAKMRKRGEIKSNYRSDYDKKKFNYRPLSRLDQDTYAVLTGGNEKVYNFKRKALNDIMKQGKNKFSNSLNTEKSFEVPRIDFYRVIKNNALLTSEISKNLRKHHKIKNTNENSNFTKYRNAGRVKKDFRMDSPFDYLFRKRVNWIPTSFNNASLINNITIEDKKLNYSLNFKKGLRRKTFAKRTATRNELKVSDSSRSHEISNDPNVQSRRLEKQFSSERKYEDKTKDGYRKGYQVKKIVQKSDHQSKATQIHRKDKHGSYKATAIKSSSSMHFGTSQEHKENWLKYW